MPTNKMPDWATGLDALSRKLQAQIPQRVGWHAAKFFQKSFRDQGFTDGSLRRWIPSKGAKANRTLKRTQSLANSIRPVEMTVRAIRVTAGNQYVRYAQIHNEGGTIQGQQTVRAHVKGPFTRKRKGRKEQVKRHMVRRHQRSVNMMIRKRQFMGSSQTLNREIGGIIDATMKEVRGEIFNNL